MSCSVWIVLRSSASVENALTETGTSCSRSSRRRAVTTISVASCPTSTASGVACAVAVDEDMRVSATDASPEFGDETCAYALADSSSEGVAKRPAAPLPNNATIHTPQLTTSRGLETASSNIKIERDSCRNTVRQNDK